MQVTIFSFLSAVIWSSILIIATYFLRKSRRSTQHFGFFTMFLLYLFGVFRMFLSFELTPPMIIKSKVIYPAIYSSLSKVYFSESHFKVSLLELLIVFWFIISVILLVGFVINYLKAFKVLAKYTVRPPDLQIDSILNGIQAKKRQQVSVLLSDDTKIPFGIGVFRKTIVLPNRAYDDDELYYILLHEYTHFLNHDIVVKLMVSIFCIIFWWNPIVCLLKKDLEQTLEIKCDLAIVKHMEAADKASYLQAIIESLKKATRTGKIPYASTALLRGGHMVEVKERFQAVMSYSEVGTKQHSNLLLLLSILGLIGLSYMYLPQPVFEAPKVTDGIGSFEFNVTDSYLKQTKNGEYELYIRDEFYGKIDKEFASILISDGFQIIE